MNLNLDTIRPLRDCILVKRKDPEKVSKGGIFIPDSGQDKQRFAEVLAVGPGKYLEKTGEIRPMSIKPGQVVFFRGNAGLPLDTKIDGLVVIREDDIDAVVDEP